MMFIDPAAMRHFCRLLSDNAQAIKLAMNPPNRNGSAPIRTTLVTKAVNSSPENCGVQATKELHTKDYFRTTVEICTE